MRSVDTSRSFQLSPVSLIPGEGVNNRNVLFVLAKENVISAPGQRDQMHDSSSPSAKIAVTVDGRDELVYFPLKGTKSNFRALAAAACISFDVVDASCLEALVEKFQEVQRQHSPYLILEKDELISVS